MAQNLWDFDQDPLYQPQPPTAAPYGFQPPFRGLAQSPEQVPPPTAPSAAPTGRMPSMPGGFGGGMDLGNMRELLQSYLEKQGAKVDKQQELSDRYAGALDNENSGQMNYAPLLHLWDSWYGTKLAPGYKAPLTESERLADEEKQQDSATKAGNPLASDLLKEYASDNSAMSKYYQALTRGEAQKQKEQANRTITSFNDENGNPIQLSKQEAARAESLRKAVFFAGRESSPETRLGLQKLTRATTAMNLMNSLKNGATPQEMASIGTDMAGLIANSNTITDAQASHFIPSNVELTGAGIWQWLMSKPQGVEQQEWMKRWKNELDQQAIGARQSLHTFITKQGQAAHQIGLPKQVVDGITRAGHENIDEGYYNPGAKTETRTYKGVTYQLTPGADRKKQESWVPVTNGQ